MKIKTGLLSALIAQALLVSAPAAALNIVLTNDDSWNTHNIKAMKEALVAKGHDVIMAAPCTGQSGKGGSFGFFKSVKVDETKAEQYEFCIGDLDTSQSFEDYVEGTPVMSVLYGIDVAAQKKWGKAPDLVVSGPNEGNNLGYMNNNSGTLGATMIALSRGIPAIAVSASENSLSDATQGPKIASVVVNVIDKLEASRADNQPLLPAYMGLNINTPEDIDASLGYRFTDVGWNGGGIALKFVEDFSDNEMIVGYFAQILLAQGAAESMEQALAMAKGMLQGKQGVGFALSDVNDSNENSEGVAVKNGYITISTIDASVQATRAKRALTQQRLSGL
ncbi:5'/3'-nucleotidase SurE [Shewanella violacea]|uniref:5'-nucleotidase n=1 Tax=Shewanella violacea (strain JCM 10179 / CIP 106290 / LMG 19151 / DSS12) TaxID=637905 RepID=D4ZD71_SHEVD|nr:5'/3'-nucleotidase SurE [Shewanella violacea]BAI99992.1 stationary-phase survival protein SurE, putative [Shewanella violacea DSS12]